jgi:hypothetical protein
MGCRSSLARGSDDARERMGAAPAHGYSTVFEKSVQDARSLPTVCEACDPLGKAWVADRLALACLDPYPA